jgi:formyltetrahydrofolate deformylase
MKQLILLTECPDKAGLISEITGVCFKHNLNIIKNSEFVDPQSKTFFMRTVLEECPEFNREDLLSSLNNILPEGSRCRILDKRKKRIVVLATKEAHCLGDILIKNYNGSFDVEIEAVISNYETLEPLTNKFDIPFHFVSHENLTREQHEAKLQSVIENYSPDYLVLAKYMRILSSSFVESFENRIINIHHSFLPAFVGASPYKQAFERGVKIIGATAHFVNNELDQGPIILQDVIHVNHSYQPDKLARAGQQLEESVLLNALQLVIREKVFVLGNRTVVFN